MPALISVLTKVGATTVRSQLALRGRGYAAYCASKGGLAMLCKQLAAEWAPEKINAVGLSRRFTALVSPDHVRGPWGRFTLTLVRALFISPPASVRTRKRRYDVRLVLNLEGHRSAASRAQRF